MEIHLVPANQAFFYRHMFEKYILLTNACKSYFAMNLSCPLFSIFLHNFG
jgi:hypothetical protein